MALNNHNSSPVDEQLLARSKKSSERAGQLKQAKQEKTTKTENDQESPSLRQEVLASRRAEEQKKIVEEKNNQAKTDKPNSFNLSTGRLLRGAWTNLISSFGLTLIWINIHVFLGTIFGEKFFCKLGMEWVNDSVKRANFEQAKKLGKTAGTFEGAGLACLDLGCLLLIIVIFMIVGGLLSVVANPLDALSSAFGWVWNQAKQLITGS